MLLRPRAYLLELFQNYFVWPERFMARECRLENEDMEPVSVAEFNRKSKNLVFGQVLEASNPKEHSNGTWNFHFIYDKNGVLVQVWVFGSKDEVHCFADKIRIDEYFVFWGYTVKENKYSTNLTSTTEGAMVILCNSTEFDCVIVTKTYQQPDP